MKRQKKILFLILILCTVWGCLSASALPVYATDESEPDPSEYFVFKNMYAEYDGDGHAPTVSCNEAEIASAGYEVYYSRLIRGELSPYTKELPVQPGNYQIKIETKETVNYSAMTIEDEDWLFRITRKPVAIEGLFVRDKVYDGTDTAVIVGTPVIDGILEGDEVSVRMGTAVFEDPDAQNDKHARAKNFKLIGDDCAKYVLKNQPSVGWASITPRPIDDADILLTHDRFEFDGLEKYVRVDKVKFSDGMVLDPDKDYDLTGDSFGTQKGQYTLTITAKGNFTGTASAQWQIVDKLVKVYAPNVRAVYDGTAYSAGVYVADTVNDHEIRYGTTEGEYDLLESPVITDAGTLTVYYRVTAPGYTDAIGSVTVSVSPRPVTVRADDKSKSEGRPDPVFTATVTGTMGSVSNDRVAYELSRVAGEKAGTYSIIPYGDERQGNYLVRYEAGKLTITGRKDPGSSSTDKKSSSSSSNKKDSSSEKSGPKKKPESISVNIVQKDGIRTIIFDDPVAVKGRIDVSAYLGNHGKYTVSPKGAAKVDKKKKIITIKKPGVITVTAYDRDGKKWVAKEAVNLRAENIAVKQRTIRAVEIQAPIDGAANIDDGALIPDSWVSSKPSVAEVDEMTGLITVRSKGSTRITAYYGNGKNAAKISFNLKVVY